MGNSAALHSGFPFLGQGGRWRENSSPLERDKYRQPLGPGFPASWALSHRAPLTSNTLDKDICGCGAFSCGLLSPASWRWKWQVFCSAAAVWNNLLNQREVWDCQHHLILAGDECLKRVNKSIEKPRPMMDIQERMSVPNGSQIAPRVFRSG